MGIVCRVRITTFYTLIGVPIQCYLKFKIGEFKNIYKYNMPWTYEYVKFLVKK